MCKSIKPIEKQTKKAPESKHRHFLEVQKMPSTVISLL